MGDSEREIKAKKKTIKAILSTMMTMRIADIQDEGILGTFMKAAGSEDGDVTIAEAVAGGACLLSLSEGIAGWSLYFSSF